MSPEQLEQMKKELAPLIAGQVIEQMKGQRDSLAGLLGGKQEPPKQFSAIRDPSTFAKFLKAVANAGPKPSKTSVIERMREFGGEDMAKAVQESTYDSAGVLVPVQNSGEIIEFLRPVSLMDKLGVRHLDFKSEMHIGKQTAATTLTWIGEGDTAAKQQPKYGKVVLKAHKGMLLVDISNDLLRNPAVGNAFVGEDARLAMANGLDDAMLNGTGQQNQPKGLIVQINPANSFVRAGTTAANFISDLDKVIENVLKADVPITNPKWLIHPTKEKELKGVRFTGDGGQFAFRREMIEEGKLNGYPYVCSTRVPVTKVVFGCWDQLIAGLDQDVLLSMHDVRAEFDETTLRAILRADFKVRQDKAFSECKDT